MATTQYRYAIHHDPPHMRPVHTFTSWQDNPSTAAQDMVRAADGLRVSVAAIDTYILCKPSGEPCGSAELQTRAAPEATGEGAAESKADALEQRAYKKDEEMPRHIVKQSGDMFNVHDTQDPESPLWCQADTLEGAQEQADIANMLDQRKRDEADAKWADRDRLYLARRTDAAAYDRTVQEVKEARE